MPQNTAYNYVDLIIGDWNFIRDPKSSITDNLLPRHKVSSIPRSMQKIQFHLPTEEMVGLQSNFIVLKQDIQQVINKIWKDTN